MWWAFCLFQLDQVFLYVIFWQNGFQGAYFVEDNNKQHAVIPVTPDLT